MATCADDRLSRALAGVSGERLATTVAALAAEPFAVRRAADPGAVAARAWLAQRLENLGAPVLLEPFTMPFVPDVYAPPSVCWSGGALVAGRDFAVHLASADRPGVRRGELAVAGSGDPAGRWLVVPAGMRLFDAFGHAHGALGLLVGRGVDADGWRYTGMSGPNPGPLAILTLDTAVHAELGSTAGAWLRANAPIRRLDRAAANLHGSGSPLMLTAHAGEAAAVAVVLEAARVLAADAGRPSVALLDGPAGARHHARRLRGSGAAPAVLHVTFDGEDDAVVVEGGGPAHALLAAIDQAGRHTGLPLAAGRVGPGNRRYAAEGLAAVGIRAAADGPPEALARLVVAAGLLHGAA